MTLNQTFAISTGVVTLMLIANLTHADPVSSNKSDQTEYKVVEAIDIALLTPVHPYPFIASGWGPEVGNGLMASRWAEDWNNIGESHHVPLLKDMLIGDAASLTLSSETRLRYAYYDNGQLKADNDYRQGLFRGILGADLHVNSNLRFYGEIGTGQVGGRRDDATANFKNDASLQQLFVDVRDYFGNALVGAMVGRQEYADGLKQLISLSDGSNLHRTWNGVRVYVHRADFRVGLFDFRATQLKQGAFDEAINDAEHIQGISVSQIHSSNNDTNTYWDSFWIHSEKPNFRYAGTVGLDDRETLGNRFWGSKGDFKFDITLAHQSGDFNDRDIDAWGLFAVNSYKLSHKGWKPKLTVHVDMASGGGANGHGTIRGFNPLYASSNYLAEGQFLSLSNLAMIASGLSVTPTKQTNLSFEYGFAQRLKDDDAVYAGGMRAYTNTQKVAGREIGGLFRAIGTWSASNFLTISINYEHLKAGKVFQLAQLPSSDYAYADVTLRY